MNFDLNAKSSPQRRPHRRPAPARQPSAQKPSTASVPISVFRELSAELQATQAMLDSLHGQNQHLRKQNVHLQQEVDSIVQAAQKMQHVVGSPNLNQGSKGASSVMPKTTVVNQDNVAQSSIDVPPQLRRAVQSYPQQLASSMMPPRVSEPPRPQEMPITPDGVEPLIVQSPEFMHDMTHQPKQTSVNTQGQSQSPFSPSRRQAAVETLNKMFTGREQPLPRRALEDESSEEIHTGWLVLIVLLIVVTAFGTGFLIVRPFLSTHR